MVLPAEEKFPSYYCAFFNFSMLQEAKCGKVKDVKYSSFSTGTHFLSWFFLNGSFRTIRNICKKNKEKIKKRLIWKYLEKHKENIVFSIFIKGVPFF